MAKVEERRSLLANWRYVLATTNPPKGHVDPVSRWLVLTRAAVLPMTLTAALIAGLLGVNERGFDWGLFVLASVGILLAHMANNLMNDLFDLDVGTDTGAYPRALYAPHPVLSGMVTRRRLTTAALLVNALDLVILVVLFVARGWPVVAFALGGFFVSAAYTAPPLRLKKHGLGEPSVLVVCGPLLVGGVSYVADVRSQHRTAHALDRVGFLRAEAAARAAAPLSGRAAVVRGPGLHPHPPGGRVVRGRVGRRRRLQALA